MLSALGDATPDGIRCAVPVRPTRGPVQSALLALPACPLAVCAGRLCAGRLGSGRWMTGRGATSAAKTTAVLDALRPMMREVVLSGTASGVADRGEVCGKTSTAEFGGNTPPDAHGWFVGYRLGGPQGDIAFALLVEGGSSSSAAVAVTGALLGGL